MYSGERADGLRILAEVLSWRVSNTLRYGTSVSKQLGGMLYSALEGQPEIRAKYRRKGTSVLHL